MAKLTIYLFNPLFIRYLFISMSNPTRNLSDFMQSP